ncbi:MAG: Spx/MgsR family transcriptional regulator [Alphaproteobacteria bacterium]|jgi:Spx/MgsR family transcriptional regulator
MYGIPNCDTIKKAKKWLDAAGVEYTFHDYKKLGVDRSVIEQCIAATSIETVVNKRGTTFRKLSEQDKLLVSDQAENTAAILDLLCNNPSMIKRPVLVKQSGNSAPCFTVGFNDSTYLEFVNGA